MENLEQGYATEHFEEDVDEDLQCPICLNVLKDPMQCQNNEHYFCLPCIKRHLQNFQTCPPCMETLTLETLKKPSRYVTKNLSKLNISCEYAHRGCEAVVKLEERKLHVSCCDFAPVKCSNQGCDEIVNRQDITNHESEVCKYHKVVCEGCKKLLREVEHLKEVIEKFQNMATCKSIDHSVHHSGARQDIIVAGGEVDGQNDLKSVEKFSWVDRTWKLMQPMKRCYGALTSFKYKNQVIVHRPVVSEKDQVKARTEAFKINRESAQWYDFPAQFSSTVFGKLVVCQDRLIVIGGCSNDAESDEDASDAIYEVLLTAPYSTKLLIRMPQPRVLHGAELVGDKIVILGGALTLEMEEYLDSVLCYHVNENKLTQMPPLPLPIGCSATVSWEDNVIVIGGVNKHGSAVNTVLMYNVNTGRIKTLPPMKCKRASCMAVRTGNVIVVMGGMDENGENINFVEHFSFDSYSWVELPPMIEQRAFATAQVI